LKSHSPIAKFILTVLLFSAIAEAETLTGTVKNVTTAKPAAGDEVILMNLSQGMVEAGRTKTDARGNFSFKLDDAQAPHLVRAVHQSVSYHRMVPPGTASLNVEVYDAGKQIDGIEVVADIMRLQVEHGELQIKREFAVQNSSKPPRTQIEEHNFEFYIPEGAKIVEGSAATEHGNPLKSPPGRGNEKNRYSFEFPLRPGTTHFQVIYKLPYSGSASIDPRSLYPLQHFLAIVPKSMEFSAAAGANFKPMNDPNQPDANVQIASATAAGQTLAFKIVGEGTLQPRVEGGSTQGDKEVAARETRPGGGLGPPIDAPDPLQNYRWYILGSIATALLASAVHVARRRQASSKTLSTHRFEEDESVFPLGKTPTSSLGKSIVTPSLSPNLKDSSVPTLLSELKEEMFNLELEHKRGDISQQEYEKVRTALGLMLERALKHETVHVVSAS
jgi:hypothetical protein